MTVEGAGCARDADSRSFGLGGHDAHPALQIACKRDDEDQPSPVQCSALSSS